MRSTTDETLTIPDIVIYDNLEELWKSCRFLIRYWACKYINKGRAAGRQGTRLYDIDDLLQAGFLALCDLGLSWPCQNNNDFRWHLWYACRNRFSDCAGTGGAGSKRLLETCLTTSLDEKIYNNSYKGSDITRVERLADEKAEFEEDLIDRLSTTQDYNAIMKEIDKLPECKRQALLLTARDGMSVQEAGELIGETPERIVRMRSTAVDKIRYSPTGRIISKDYQPRHVSYNEYLITRVSEVEKAVLWMEEG